MGLVRSLTISRPKPLRKASARTAARRKFYQHNQQLDLFGFVDAGPRITSAQIAKWAMGVWYSAIDARHAILCGRWCASQNLKLPEDIDGDVLRFHPSLKFGNDRAPGLIWLLRDLHTDEPTAIVRMYLGEGGNVIARRTLGRVYNTAIKLSDNVEVTTGLHVASTIENGVAAMNAGYRPLWIVTALADLPVLDIDALTIVAAPDDIAAQTVAACWRAAGRDIIITSNEEPPRSGELHGGELPSIRPARGPP